MYRPKNRKRESRGQRRSFARSASKTHVKNIPRNPMRGGIRL